MREGSADASNNLDPWYVDLQGQGDGSINLLGKTAYSGLMGSYPTALCWDSFHNGDGAIVARQDYKLKFWAPTVEVTIKGNWDSIYKSFSTDFEAHYLFAASTSRCRSTRCVSTARSK